MLMLRHAGGPRIRTLACCTWADNLGETNQGHFVATSSGWKFSFVPAWNFEKQRNINAARVRCLRPTVPTGDEADDVGLWVYKHAMNVGVFVYPDPFAKFCSLLTSRGFEPSALCALLCDGAEQSAIHERVGVLATVSNANFVATALQREFGACGSRVNMFSAMTGRATVTLQVPSGTECKPIIEMLPPTSALDTDAFHNADRSIRKARKIFKTKAQGEQEQTEVQVVGAVGNITDSSPAYSGREVPKG